MKRLVGLLSVLASLLFPAVSSAHGQRSAYLELTQTEHSEIWLVRVQSAFPLPGLRAVLPTTCEVLVGSDQVHAKGGASLFLAKCPAGLAGQRIGVSGLNPDVPEAVLRVEDARGHSQAARLTLEAPEYLLPATGGFSDTLGRFVALGVSHVLSGADHLLFLLLLVFCLRKFQAVMIAESAFTLSHSISFSLTALGVLSVPAAAAEACIALSLALLALEVLAPSDSRLQRLRSQAALAFVFGAVHGLGFASGLQAAGLPQGDAAAALLGFGVGVELGQLSFLACAFCAVALVARTKVFGGVRLGVVYAAGALACFWLFERLQIAWPAL